MRRLSVGCVGRHQVVVKSRLVSIYDVGTNEVSDVSKRDERA